MNKVCLDLTITDVSVINDKYVVLKLTSKTILPDMIAGQFVNVSVPNSPTTFLRRPISINFFDKNKNELWLLIAAIGEGTRALTQLKISENLNCMLPLGKGFTMPKSADDKVLLVGGGVGVAPLLYLGEQIKQAGGFPNFLLGARTSNDLVEMAYFNEIGKVFTTTEDGSRGEKGFVTNHSILQQEKFDFIATCGPKPMMMAVAHYAKQANIDCEASLENTMACGIGACLCCVEKTVKGNTCVCTEGPVFNMKELLWQI